MQWHIALHMHKDITLSGCECMVGKSTQCLVFDLMDLVNGTMSNKVARLNKMIKKIFFGYQQAGIDPPLPRVENPPIMVRHSP